MRQFFTALALPLVLLACASETPPAPVQAAIPVAQPAPSGAPVAFPNPAEVAAGRPIRIRPAASFGIYGPLESLPGAPSCGVLQDAETNRALPVASPDGPVTPVFNIGGRCPRNDTGRGVPLVRMDRAWILANGIYMQGARYHCFLPNVGRNSACVPRS